ncbi:MAG: hypothetical protein AAGJ51_14040 [Pseudomonadota bacterium]
MNPIPTWDLHGYVMTCRNDCVATGAGEIPDALSTLIGGKAFQKQLNSCDVVILGRYAHEAMPNTQNRTRVILSSAATALEHKEGGWWWNPSQMPLENMLRLVAPSGGKVAINGGRTALTYFLQNELNTLHMCRAESVAIKDGLRLFAMSDRLVSMDDVMRNSGMELIERKLIDLKAPVSLSTWQRD